MDINAISSIISTVGFPIACCGACFWYIVKSDKSHKEEMDKMSTALNNNTLVIQKLIDRIDKSEVITSELQ